MQHVLHCECGRQMVVTQGMPGLTVTCACGRVLHFSDHEQIFDDDDTAPDTPMAAFVGTLYHLTPRCFVTPTLFWLNIGVFALMVLTGVNLMDPDLQDLVNWGAEDGYRTLSGEYWRMLTCMFVHIGVIHVAVNMWALWNVGFLVERLLGNTGFVIVYFVSGLAGSMATLFWNQNVVAAGASGALFGIIGALFGFAFRRRDTVPSRFLMSLRSSLTTFVIANVAISIMVPGIGIAAHLGGLASGYLCGVALSQPVTLDARRRRPLRNLAVAAGSMLVLGIAFLLLPKPVVDVEREIAAVSKQERQALNAYENAETRLRKGEIQPAEMADILERDLLPQWRQMTDHLESLQNVREDQKRLYDLLLESFQARQRSWELEVESIRKDDSSKMEQSLQQEKLANQARQKLINRH